MMELSQEKGVLSETYYYKCNKPAVTVRLDGSSGNFPLGCLK